MARQSGRAVSVRYKVQSALGTPATGTGGKELPFAPSAGLTPNKATINDPTVRADGMTLIGRHGSRSVSGTYDAVARLSALDEILQAIVRGTYVATDTLTEADFTSITTEANAIVFASGSPIALGVRRGMVIRLANHSTAANNNRNLNVVNVDATKVYVAETLTVNAVADLDVDIVLPKYVASANPPTDRYYTIEQHYQDITKSKLFQDCVFSSLALALQPDNTAMLSIGVVGVDFDAENAAVLTDPTTYSTRAMVATDASLIVNGVKVLDLTGLSFAYDLTAATVPVVGGSTSPDVFKNQAQLSGSITAMVADLSRFEAFRDEDEVAIAITLIEPDAAAPEDFLSFYIPLAKFSGNSDPLGGDNALLETIPFIAGKSDGVSGTADTMLMICTSAA